MNAQLKSLKERATAGELLLIDTVEMLVRDDCDANNAARGVVIPLECVTILEQAIEHISKADQGLNENLANAHWARYAENAMNEYRKARGRATR